MERIYDMKPTKSTLFFRQCKILQLCKFIYLNFTIFKVAVFPPRSK
jgi:hypothetical protein